MAVPTLVIANKAYSSWSLRAWLALKATGTDFEEVVIPLRQADTAAVIRKYSPSGKVPVLIDGEVTIWESLAIVEYLAESFPDAGLWPADGAARAFARAASAEMHGGFLALRRALPMNVRHAFPDPELDDETRVQINRIQAIWRESRRRFGTACGDGPFLMGGFSALDAFYAPVASRFATYGIDLEKQAASFVDAILAHPFMEEWCAGAHREPWIIPEYEIDGESD